MSRECEICGRPLRSGRKYCWEHRNTKSNNNYLFKKRFTKPFIRILAKPFMLIWIIFLVIFGFFMFKYSSKEFMTSTAGIWLDWIVGILSFILIVIYFKFVRKEKQMFKIDY